ncbi:glycosyltransferase [Candidatus Peregrinibacteria bacterium]|nr:glycosyltransferase [Candidatus Peregrinibacteria bacterium]
MTQIKASIIILDYLKSRRVVENVRSTLAQKTDFPFEIIIVDNSAKPENAKKLEPLKYLQNVKVYINDKNVGYVRGTNQGVSRSKGEYLFIVNPDILWPENHILQNLVDYMESHPEIGVLGPKQINDNDGSVAMTVRRFPRLALQISRRTWLRKLPFIRYLVKRDECQDLDYGKTQPVDWLQSSFWVVRRKLWDKLGGLNKNYFIFMADPDFCFECWKAEKKVIYHPEITVHADGRRASEGGMKEFFSKWILRQHVRDSLKYMGRHLFKPNPRKRFQKP